jgi:4,5-dihydroxyphthalate decarboxylase
MSPQEDQDSTMRAIPVSLATRNYDYIQPLAMGDVPTDGLELRLTRSFDALQRVMAETGELDGGEVSLSRYLQRQAKGDRSVVGLPIFLMRGFRQRTFLVRRDSPFRDVTELVGKRAGINEWPATGNTWARAVLRERGVDIWSLRWLMGQVSAGYKPVPDDALPVGVERAPSDSLLVEQLIAGEIDALVCPWPPPPFYERDSPIRRLYEDFAPVERAYFRRTGVYPAHHCVALKRPLVEAHPALVGRVYRAFDEARRQTMQNHRELAETLPWLLAELEEDTALIGQDFQPYGTRENAHMIAAFCDELYAQGLTSERIDPASAFADFERLVDQAD